MANHGNDIQPKPMFWSSALEDSQLKLRKLSLKNIGDYVLPILNCEINNLATRAASGEFKNFHYGLDNNIVNVDASFIAVAETRENEDAFFGSVSRLGATALKKATKTDFDFLNLNLKVSFKKILILLPGGSYKSFTKPAMFESGFAGTILIQVPVQNGIEGSRLNVIHQNEVIAQLDLTKNSSIYSHLALLLDPASGSTLHFEITAPTSGAVFMLVFHLIWPDSFKLTKRLSTLPAFFNFMTNLKASIAKAVTLTSHDEANGDTCPAKIIPWNYPLFYLPLPQVATLSSSYSLSLSSETQDFVFALSTLKEFEVLGVQIENVSRDSNGNSNVVIIRKIVNPGNSNLTPTEWTGNILQITQISAAQSDDVIMECMEEFGALVIPRRELLWRSCLNDLHHVIETIQCRSSNLGISMASESLSSKDQLIYDLGVVIDFVVGNQGNFGNQVAVADLRVLLDTCLQLNLNELVAAVLQNLETQVLPKNDDRLSTNAASTEACQAYNKEIAELIHHYYTQLGKSSSPPKAGDFNKLILDTLSLHSKSFNVKLSLVSVEEIDKLIESLSSISVNPSAPKSPAVFSQIGAFFLRFGTEQLIKVFLNFRRKHPAIHESFPQLYDELFKCVPELNFSSCCKTARSQLLEDLADFYAKSENIAAFARVFMRTSFGKDFSNRRLRIFSGVLMSRIENWATLKSFCDTIKRISNGTALLDRLIRKFIATLKNTSSKSANYASKNAKIKHQARTSLTHENFAQVVRFTALGLIIKGGSSSTSPTVPGCIQEILDLTNENQRCLLFSDLVMWDEDGLKSDSDILCLTTEFFYSFLRGSKKKALEMSDPNVWSKIADCFGWKANLSMIENFMKEIITPFREKKGKKQSNMGSNIFRGILRSCLGFGSNPFTMQKPMLKEKFIDEILDLWITETNRLVNESNSLCAEVRNGIVRCICAFFRARKFNLFMPKSLAHVPLLHKMVKTFNLRNLVAVFEEILAIEVDPVRPVSKAVDSISWRLYVSMCSWAISCQELEGFLRTCDPRQAELFYGFALWCGNKHMLDNLNEKIIGLTGPDLRSDLRKSLANLPYLKLLAMDACSKEALNYLSGIQTVAEVWPVSGGNTEEVVEEKLHGQPEGTRKTADNDEPPVKRIKIEPEV